MPASMIPAPDSNTEYWCCFICNTSWPMSVWEKTKSRVLSKGNRFWHRCPNKHWHQGAEPGVWHTPRTSIAHKANGTSLPRLG
jgi:hypothetical protein